MSIEQNCSITFHPCFRCQSVNCDLSLVFDVSHRTKVLLLPIVFSDFLHPVCVSVGGWTKHKILLSRLCSELLTLCVIFSILIFFQLWFLDFRISKFQSCFFIMIRGHSTVRLMIITYDYLWLRAIQ